MKQKALILIAFALITGSATALVGHNNTSDGDVSITSGEPAGVVANDVDANHSVEMTGQDNQTENQVRNVERFESSISFSGTVKAPTPCHVLEREVTQNNGSYVMNIQTVRNESENQACAEVITGITYDAEFEAEPGFELEVQHNGEKVETIRHEKEEKRSLLRRILSIFGF